MVNNKCKWRVRFACNLTFEARKRLANPGNSSLKGQVSYQILQDALSVLERLDHSGTRGAEENTGDGE